MFTNRKMSWVWMGALLLALAGGAIAASVAVSDRSLHGRGGLRLVRPHAAPPAQPARRMSWSPPGRSFRASNTLYQPEGAPEGIDEVALRQA
jgi:hypothetical protein